VANMGLARAAGLPVIVVGDIDRGGVFAALYGTVALMPPGDQELVSGFIINKFRGAPELLDSGITMLGRLTGRPLLGVLPWAENLWLDAEDSLALTRPIGPARLSIGAICDEGAWAGRQIGSERLITPNTCPDLLAAWHLAR
jgi:adenosylcobyric acid synthase